MLIISSVASLYKIKLMWHDEIPYFLDSSDQIHSSSYVFGLDSTYAYT